MKQVIQNFKTGDLYIDDVSVPSLSEGLVLVENKFSLISAGTERGTVKVAQSSLLGKAKQRPDLVAQVIQNIRKEGLSATLEKVKTKLNSLKALGYSTSGVVAASMDSDSRFKPGDRVACAGQDYASHAEVVAIPQNLVTKIPDNVTFEEASFTTLGAIALQGIRQSDPKLGDNVCVIGLGLLGQLTCQLLKANGCNVFGIDVSSQMVELANIHSADKAMLRSDNGLKSSIGEFTNGHGFDSIIITAAGPTNDPIELSAEIARKKGVVVMVGAVKMDIPRDPHFYRKELELKMSCSYGPGRYDVGYEEKGIDYPYAYVRWTEQRNMEAFLSLISSKRVNLSPLITHVFDITEAEAAYDIVLGKKPEHHIGILLGYKENKEKFQTLTRTGQLEKSASANIGFIGAGSFAQSYLLPNIPSANSVLNTVVTTRGITSKDVADKFSFISSSTSAADVMENKNINTVFVATRHDSHARYTADALKVGKNVFVEKPLALNPEELKEVVTAYKTSEGGLMVGFNRRFAPVAVEAKKLLKSVAEPLVMNFRINAGHIPHEHWIQDGKLGGGRIIGEMCHFVDLMQFFTDSTPVKVFAECIDGENTQLKNDDNISVVFKFADGSVGNLTYVANGDKSVPKEHIEIFAGGKTFVIHDFKEGTFHSGNAAKKVKLSGKGHKQEVESFISAVLTGSEMPITFDSLCYTTLTTFKIKDALVTGFPQKIDINEIFG